MRVGSCVVENAAKLWKASGRNSAWIGEAVEVEGVECGAQIEAGYSAESCDRWKTPWDLGSHLRVIWKQISNWYCAQ